MYLTVEDRGTCSRIESIKVWYNICAPLAYPEAYFPQTVAPLTINGSITVTGTCSGSSINIPSGTKPTAGCRYDGTWTKYVNNCPCRAGQERGEITCKG